MSVRRDSFSLSSDELVRLNERQVFHLNGEDFAAFEALIDAPIGLSKLAELLSEDSPFGVEIRSE